MMGRFRRALRRFGKDENGSVFMLEFVIMVPLLFSTFLMAVEMGLYSTRQMFLDRGLDVAVRHVRLNTNTPMSHNQIKDMICAASGFLEDCDSSLRLEMRTVDPRNFGALDPNIDCVDLSQPTNPVKGWELGKPHELMLLRACVKFRPVFPTSGLGYALDKDGSGRSRMTAVAAFVQEPN